MRFASAEPSRRLSHWALDTESPSGPVEDGAEVTRSRCQHTAGKPARLRTGQVPYRRIEHLAPRKQKQWGGFLSRRSHSVRVVDPWSAALQQHLPYHSCKPKLFCVRKPSGRSVV